MTSGSNDTRQLAFRDNLRWLLKVENINQADLSLRTGLPYKWIRRLSHHGLTRTDRRTIERLKQLADHFGVEVEDFWKPRSTKSRILQCKLFRYVGSKHKLARAFVSTFPVSIKAYYEPFLGSGEVLGALIDTNHEVERYVCSDICRPLIEVWRLIHAKPERLAAQYEDWYKRFQMSPEKTYSRARNKLNDTGDPIAYYFLNRTCRLGKMTFNKNGNLVSGLHYGMQPIDSETVFQLASQWQAKLKLGDIVFKARDYSNVTLGSHDFAYLDPPYFVTPSYRHKFSARRFFNWLRKQEPRFALSLGFSAGSNNLLTMPVEFEAEMFEFKTGSSSICRLKNVKAKSVTEQLFVSDEATITVPNANSDQREADCIE